jgi:5'-nucleotidase / UDP-sugar diphosphatase
MLLPLLPLLTLTAHAAPLTVLHTNDWQSRLTGAGPDVAYTPDTVGDDQTVGGVARLATMVAERRAQAVGPVLLLDGGDVTMGTLFHTVTRETGAELQLMSTLGYDAITLGNHEFDLRPGGLADMVRAAQAGAGCPPIVATNLVLDPTDPRDDGLEALLDEGAIVRSLVIERDGVKVGLIGLMGEDATESMGQASPVTISNAIEAARAEIARMGPVDVVIALSHSGVRRQDDGSWGDEDVDLLRAVPEIALVVSGHSHTVLREPILEQGRGVVQAGSDTQWLGEVQLVDGKVASSVLHPVDDQWLGDPEITTRIDALKRVAEERVLAPIGYRFDQPIAEADADHGRAQDEHVIGNLVTDAFREATGADIAATGNGTLRSDIDAGTQQVSDIFRISSLGIGTVDDTPGYALVKFWLTGTDLKQLMEFLLIGYVMKGGKYYPRLGGAQIHYNAHRVPFDLIYDIEIGDDAGGYTSVALDDDHLYSIGTTTYVMGFLPIVNELSFGILDPKVRDAEGALVDDLDTLLVDADPTTPGVQELKAWRALLDHVQRLPDADGDGLPEILSTGPSTEERLRRDEGWSPVTLLKNATWRTGAVIGIVLFPIGVIAFVARWLIRRRRLRAR